MMTNPAEIEAIVRVVVRRLREQGALAVDKQSASAAKVATTSFASVSQSPGSPSSEKSLRWPGKLITLEAITGRLEGLKRLQVAPGTVITPAVADELRQRGIQLERVAEEPAGFRHSAQGLLVIADSSLYSQVSAYAEFTAASQNCAADVRRIAAHFNSGGKSAIWRCETPFAAMQAAAKDSLFRPAQLARPEDLARAVREVDANLIILDAHSWDLTALTKLVADWSVPDRLGAIRTGGTS